MNNFFFLIKLLNNELSKFKHLTKTILSLNLLNKYDRYIKGMFNLLKIIIFYYFLRSGFNLNL